MKMYAQLSIEQRYAIILEKAERAQAALNEMLEVGGELCEQASTHIFLIRQSVRLCEINMCELYLSFLHRDLALAFEYVTDVRRIWRKRSRQCSAIVWVSAPDTVRNYTVGYYRDGQTGNYIVTYAPEETKHLTSHRPKQAVFLPGALRRISSQVTADSVAGVIDVSYRQMVKLGFFIEKVSAA